MVVTMFQTEELARFLRKASLVVGRFSAEYGTEPVASKYASRRPVYVIPALRTVGVRHRAGFNIVNPSTAW